MPKGCRGRSGSVMRAALGSGRITVGNQYKNPLLRIAAKLENADSAYETPGRAIGVVRQVKDDLMQLAIKQESASLESLWDAAKRLQNIVGQFARCPSSYHCVAAAETEIMEIIDERTAAPEPSPENNNDNSG